MLFLHYKYADISPARVFFRELLLDGVEVTAAVRPSSSEKANSLFSDKSFMSGGEVSLHAFARTKHKFTSDRGNLYT